MARMAHLVSMLYVLAGAAHSQEAMSETPPELRDFRLEPERSESPPPPGPEMRQPSASPIAEPVLSPREPAGPVPPLQSARSVQSPQTVKRSETSEPDTSKADAVPNTPVDADAVTVAAPELTLTPASKKVSTESDGAKNLPWWQIVAAFLTVIASLLVAFFSLRRTKHSALVEAQVEPIGAGVGKVSSTTPLATTALPLEPIAKAPQHRPEITLEFTPERAVLSFVAMTVTGKLLIVNSNTEPVTEMQLRATMLSANSMQSKTIDAFFKGDIPTEINALNGVNGNERLAIEIEISIPANELESHAFGNRDIFVPIIVADIAYSWPNGSDVARLACLVGRESQPPQTKMRPLRLDLGPRSFSKLGRRTL